jgi:hypothetical protein
VCDVCVFAVIAWFLSSCGFYWLKKFGSFVYGLIFWFFWWRERRMKQLVCMRSLWSRFKGIMRPDQRLLFEVELSIPMRNWRLILKVS